MENIAGGQFKAEVLSPPNEDRLLDPKNFIDKEVLRYIHQIQNDTAPSQSDQRNLIKSIHQKDKAAEIDLINLNKGLILSIVFAFNSPNFETSLETIPASVTALLEAAATYDFNVSKTSFTNYAIPKIHQALQEVVFSAELPYTFNDETPPLYTIYKYLSTLKKKPNPDPENKEIDETASLTDDSVTLINPIIDEQLNETNLSIKNEKVFDLTLLESKIISYIHLPRSVIMEKTNTRNMTVQTVISKLARRTQTANQQALALHLYAEGFIPTIPAPSVQFEEVFHPLQIKVLQNLQLTKQELATKFNFPEHSIGPLIRDALIVTGARTTTELLLMAHAYGQQDNAISDLRDENAS